LHVLIHKESNDYAGTGCGKIRSTAVSLKGRGFSRASRLFASTALAAEGRSCAEIDFLAASEGPGLCHPAHGST
jgi:hypothetical protein